MDADTRLHLAIARAANNPIFENIGSTIQSIVRTWYPRTYYIPETNEREMSEHRAIADAIAIGDSDGAGNAMRAHLVAASTDCAEHLPGAGSLVYGPSRLGRGNQAVAILVMTSNQCMARQAASTPIGSVDCSRSVRVARGDVGRLMARCGIEVRSAGRSAQWREGARRIPRPCR
ncbi:MULTISPECIES: FadR/GntR family transcriptional regulator [Bradyrhizobium]|uniref:FadR/GntR family transcriptional regulator n=1 Tax=Bradyrhizobium TaxID=374 RepID=UPI0035D88D8E|nr:FadR family transcriptional regulator [Bradyrhizobium australafricanum]MCC8969985.1 FadR family transcriptional regulator [Bradyrhizobium brasilense]